jgi:hypothetical protein
LLYLRHNSLNFGIKVAVPELLKLLIIIRPEVKVMMDWKKYDNLYVYLWHVVRFLKYDELEFELKVDTLILPNTFINAIVNEGYAILREPDFPWRKIQEMIGPNLKACQDVRNHLKEILDMMANVFPEREVLKSKYSYLWLSGNMRYALYSKTERDPKPEDVEIIDTVTRKEIDISPNFLKQAVIQFMRENHIQYTLKEY